MMEWRTASGRDRGVFLLVAAAVAGLYALQVASVWVYTVDDAWITLRAARNLADGHGFVYNPGGPRVESYTNHLLWLFQACVILAGGSGIFWTKLTGAIAGGATLLVSVALGRDLLEAGGVAEDGPPLVLTLTGPAWLAVLLVLPTGAVGGLETAHFAAFVTAGFWLVLRWIAREDVPPWQPVVGGVLLGLATWTRPEGIAWAAGTCASVGIACLLRRKSSKPVLAAAAIAFAFWAALSLFRLSVYGQLHPNTYYVKMASDPLSRMASATGYLRDFLVLNHGWAFFAAVPGLLLARRANVAAPVIAVFAILGHLALVLYEGGDWIPHLRLIAPCTGVAAAVVTFGAGALVCRLPRRAARLAAYSLPVAVLGAMPFLVRGENLRVLLEVQTRVYGWKDGHTALADWLAEWNGAHRNETGRPLLVAIEDIGLVGWIADVEIVDIAGLADPQWARLSYEGIDHYPAFDLVLARDPEVIVLVSNAPPVRGEPLVIRWRNNRAIYEEPEFAKRYRPGPVFVHKDFPGDGYFLNVFLRNDVAGDAPPADPPVARARRD